MQPDLVAQLWPSMLREARRAAHLVGLRGQADPEDVAAEVALTLLASKKLGPKVLRLMSRNRAIDVLRWATHYRKSNKVHLQSLSLDENQIPDRQRRPADIEDRIEQAWRVATPAQRCVISALRRHKGSMKLAAKSLGITRQGLYEHIYGIRQRILTLQNAISRD
jgi:hypothetical protein